MVTKLLTGVAKSLFILGCSFLAVGGLALYASWRCLRAAFKSEHGMPVRDATFGLMMAAAVLANALRERELRRLKREAAMNGHRAPGTVVVDGQEEEVAGFVEEWPPPAPVEQLESERDDS